jgi:SSS family solute:Na+ symporter
MDFYSRLRPNVSQHQLVWVGRIATTVMVIIGLFWIPVIRGGKGLYDYLQGVQSYLAPPIFVVFFLGVFSKRLNAKGCLATLITGFSLGLFRLAIDTPVKLLDGFTFIFLVCVVVMIVVSKLTEEPAYEKIDGLTFSTTSGEDRQSSRDSWSMRDVVASVLVLILIIAAYLYFTG